MRNTQLKHINSLYFILILIFSGYATSFYRSDIGIIFYIFLTISVYAINKIKITKRFRMVLIIWSLYCFGMMAFSGVLFPGFYLRHVLYFSSGYLLISIYGNSFFRKFEQMVYIFSLISLFFMAWFIIYPSGLIDIMYFFDIANYKEDMGFSTKNIFIFTLHRTSFEYYALRNCGFAWEPGSFSIFVSVAILFNLYRTKMRLSKNFSLAILLLTLFTTFSTTGVLSVSLLFTYIYFSTNKLNITTVLGGLFLLLVLSYGFYKIDFLNQKIASLYSSGDAETIIDTVNRTNEKSSLGRFAAFEVGWIDFKSNPIFGYAGASELGYLNRIGVKANMVSGLASLGGTYGLFGIFGLIFFLRRAGFFVAQVHNSKAQYGYIFVIIIAMFSFHAQNFAVLYAPLMYYCTIKTKLNYSLLSMNKYIQDT